MNKSQGDFGETKYPFCIAGRAGRISSKWLRNLLDRNPMRDSRDPKVRQWLIRKQVLFDADKKRNGNKHRRFSYDDLLKIAVMSYLTKLGASITAADEYAASLKNEMRHQGNLILKTDERVSVIIDMAGIRDDINGIINE